MCDDASDSILEWLHETCELLNAGFDNLLAPLVDLFLLIDDIVGADDLLDCSLRDLFDLLGIEVLIIVKVVHCSSAFFIFSSCCSCIVALRVLLATGSDRVSSPLV